jgi:hypothetical protein
MRPVIARVWKGVAQGRVNAHAYLRHLDANVMPMDAVRRFAGRPPERAVVEPEARAVLSDFDDLVRHYEVER